MLEHRMDGEENDMGTYAMMFPDTVEEFMEEYKMVDREHIYSNGCEYVPIYRMKQWFAHKPQIDLVKCEECEWSNGECSVGERYQGGCTFGERRADE